MQVQSFFLLDQKSFLDFLEMDSSFVYLGEFVQLQIRIALLQCLKNCGENEIYSLKLSLADKPLPGDFLAHFICPQNL